MKSINYNMLSILFVLVLFFKDDVTLAQNNQTLLAGKITYEKTVNMYALIKQMVTPQNSYYLQPELERFKQQYPQFYKSLSSLEFNKEATLFHPVRQSNSNNSTFYSHPMVTQNNTIIADLLSKTFTASRNIFDQTYVIQDTFRKIKWKITDESRDIAGFSCRRANGIVLDSIYVVAFFSNQIPIAAGPELFNGLPGMILGVVLPHDHVSWFATKIEFNSGQISKPTLPTRSKVFTMTDYQQMLEQSRNNWGNYRWIGLKAFLL